MRPSMKAAILAAVMMAAASVAMQAQIIDPSTGVMVDPTSDPSDFMAVASGQPGNIGMELNAQATEQANATMQQAMTTAPDAFAATDNTSTDVAPVPVVPGTPKPMLSPNGGTFQGSVQVVISDSDPEAAIFYTTNGKKPTTSSARYLVPLAVSAKEKIRAMAVVPGDRASGVATKTFKIG